MRFAAPILRFSLIPIAAFYVALSTVVDGNLPFIVAGCLILATAVNIFRGFFEGLSPFQGGLLTSAIGACLFAPIFNVATFVTPGICTDVSIVYEIALASFAFLGIILWSHSLSKLFVPVGLKGLTRSEIDHIGKIPVKVLFAMILFPVAMMAGIVDQGACAPGNDDVLVGALGALFVLSICVYALSASRRRHKHIAKHLG